MSNELTKAQIERQDIVDNACHRIIADVLGVDASALEWDIEPISELRETIFEEMVAALGISEMTWYPYLQEGEPEEDVRRERLNELYREYGRRAVANAEMYDNENTVAMQELLPEIQELEESLNGDEEE